MREIDFNSIVSRIEEICIRATHELPDQVLSRFKTYRASEANPLASSILDQCIINAEISRNEHIPLCQDTGLAVFFVKYGIDLRINGGTGMIHDAIQLGTELGYKNGYLRKSILSDPLFDRKNTGTNTPAVIHLDLVPGDGLEITFFPKGGGAENMSRLKMLTPSEGIEGVIQFVIETVVQAGGNPCPPLVVGIGIGGNFEESALLSKKALLRDLDLRNPDTRYADLENTILAKLNATDVGPQGLGGAATAFAVNIEWQPCHLASLPVAVNLNCHSHRIMKISL